ncbi:ORF6N domain-containing protein [Candidatus Sumerlaeota bacterium]|nr:ORF6N domain-containing protein [Candidatus Sumerlaeota bacterium]
MPRSPTHGRFVTLPHDIIAIPPERIEGMILTIRGQRVLIDQDLADLYGVETKTLIRAVKRNIDRFPDDFIFQLSKEEHASLRYQFGTSNRLSRSVIPDSAQPKSHVKKGRGGRRHLPYAFTEQGVAMLSSVLRSPRAVQVNIEIMRAFVRMRQLLASHADLTQKLNALERRYDAQFKVVFDAIRQLMKPAPPPRHRRIGYTGE